MMDSSAMAYFQSMNPLSRKIVQDTQMVQDFFEEKWEQYDEKRQNEILNDFFVHPDVRKKYQNYEKSDSYPISYPVLKIQMGETIVVDETNDVRKKMKKVFHTPKSLKWAKPRLPVLLHRR